MTGPCTGPATIVFSPCGLLQNAIIFQLPAGACQSSESFFTLLVNIIVDEGSNGNDLVLSASFLASVLTAITASRREGSVVALVTVGITIAILLPPVMSLSANARVLKPSASFKNGPPGGQPLPSVISIVRPRFLASCMTAITLA